MPANHSVLAHHRGPALERLRIPIECLSPALVHRVETYVPPLRHLEEQAVHHTLPLRLHLGIERPLELFAPRFVLVPELVVDLGGHLVHPELDDRYIRRRWLEI